MGRLNDLKECIKNSWLSKNSPRSGIGFPRFTMFSFNNNVFGSICKMKQVVPKRKDKFVGLYESLTS